MSRVDLTGMRMLRLSGTILKKVCTFYISYVIIIIQQNDYMHAFILVTEMENVRFENAHAIFELLV
jgi:hypothetical protein